jgi:hypothetical protein
MCSRFARWHSVTTQQLKVAVATHDGLTNRSKVLFWSIRKVLPMNSRMLARVSDRRARLVLGIAVGALTGGIVFWASRLGGWSLFVLAGAVAGAAAAVAVQFYGRAYELRDVTVSIPHLSELRFSVTRDSRLVAWRLFVETSSRVSTQPLTDGAGNLREAMSSLYGLFQATRDTLKEAVPARSVSEGPTVEQLAMAMLNLEMRPFLSRWHPQLGEWEAEHAGRPEREWPADVQCRQELQVLQEHLHEYAVGFASLAGAGDAERLLKSPESTSPSSP